MPLKLRMGKRTGRYELSRDLYVISVQLVEDSHIIQCTLSTESTGQDCLDYICQRLELQQGFYFGLRFKSLRMVYRWVELDKPLRKQLERNSQEQKLHFAVMFHTPTAGTLTDEVTRNYYFLQMKSDIVEGRLLVNPEKAILLASYSLQVELGDHEDVIHSVDFLKRYTLLPKHLTRSTQVLEDLITQVIQGHKCLKGMSQAEAELRYVSETQQCEGYGEEYFQGRDLEDGSEVFVGYCQEGIVVRRLQGVPMKYKWEKIMKISSHKRNLTIDLTEINTARFIMEDVETAKYAAMICKLQFDFFRKFLWDLPKMVQDIRASLDLPPGFKTHHSNGIEIHSDSFQNGYAVIPENDIIDGNKFIHSTPGGQPGDFFPEESFSPVNERGEVLLKGKHLSYSSPHMPSYANIPSTSFSNTTVSTLTPSTLHLQPPSPHTPTNHHFDHRNGGTGIDIDEEERRPLGPAPKTPPVYRAAPDYETALNQPSLEEYRMAMWEETVLSSTGYVHHHPPMTNLPMTDLSNGGLEGPRSATDGYTVIRTEEGMLRYSNPDISSLNRGESLASQGLVVYYQNQQQNDGYGMLQQQGSEDALGGPRKSRPLCASTPDLALSALEGKSQSSPDLVSRSFLVTEPLQLGPKTSFGRTMENLTNLDDQKDYTSKRRGSLQIANGIESQNKPHNGFSDVERSFENHKSQENGVAPPITHHNLSNGIKETQSKNEDLVSSPQPKPLRQRYVKNTQQLQQQQQQPQQQQQSKEQKKEQHHNVIALRIDPEIEPEKEDEEKEDMGAATVIFNPGIGISRPDLLPLNDNSEISNDERLAEMEARLRKGILREEFDKLPKKRVSAGVSTAQKMENQKRNRYSSILPYEDTRVHLKPNKHNAMGYINASNIQIPIGEVLLKYIAAQAPTKDTVEDFWQMIWECGAQIIVMLTKVEEENGQEGSYKYWPSKGESKTKLKFGDYHITVQPSTSSKSQVTSSLLLKHVPSSQKRLVYHLQYLDWPSTGGHGNVDSFLGFLDEVSSVKRHLENEAQRNIENSRNRSDSRANVSHNGHGPFNFHSFNSGSSGSWKGGGRGERRVSLMELDPYSLSEERSEEAPPLVVHCCSGAGRTGVYILTELMIYCLEHNQELDVPRALTMLRQQRMHVVQSYSQYKFVYNCLVDYLRNSRLI